MATRTPKATSDKRQATRKEVKTGPKKARITVDSYSAAGTKGTTTLPETVFGQKLNKSLLAQAVRVFLSNQRSAKAKTKTRGEVSYTTAKVYRQKGTGHARHGDKGAPIFVGGGIAHGPRGLQNYKLSMSKVLKKKGLVSALSARVANGQVVVADFEKIGTKTNAVSKLVKKMGVSLPFLLVSEKNNDLERASRNIPGLNLVQAQQLTTYEALSGRQVVLTPGAVDVLEKRTKGRVQA